MEKWDVAGCVTWLVWPTLIPSLFFSYPTRLCGITEDQCRGTDHLRSLGAQGFLFKADPNSIVKSHTQKIQSLLVSCCMWVITLTCFQRNHGFIIGLYVTCYVFVLPDFILEIILTVCILYFGTLFPFIMLTSNLITKWLTSPIRLIFCSRLVLLTLSYSKSDALLKRRIWQLISSILHL